jgi:patatin-like phospholipase/acyl hydrolase
MARSQYSVLTIDGGGIRGDIPAGVLDAIEDRMGRPVCQLFDMVSGTSTGGIIALGLNKPGDAADKPAKSASDLLELYMDRGGELFPHSLWREIRAAGGLLDVRCPSQPLENL